MSLGNVLQRFVSKQAYTLKFVFNEKPGVDRYTFPIVQNSKC